MKRIPSLDGLRAISIAMVVLGHMAKSGHAPHVFWSQFAATGVDVFFVLSGFLITTLLIREREFSGEISLRSFYARRALRIFPAAIVFMSLMIAFYWGQLRWYHSAAALLYLANYDITRPWIFGHLWSLSIEEQFYLLWPSLLRKWYKHRTRVLVGAVLLAPTWQAACYLFKFKAGLGAFPSEADTLAVGCLLAVFGHRIPKIGSYAALALTFLVMLLPFYPASNPARILFALFLVKPALYFSIGGLVLHVIHHPYWILNCKPVVWLGRISYSLYLWQQPFCADPNLRHGYFVVFALACACLSYYLVEQPILRIRDRRRSGGVNYVSSSSVAAAA